jgi:hypothetical protein
MRDRLAMGWCGHKVEVWRREEETNTADCWVLQRRACSSLTPRCMQELAIDYMS